MVESDNTIEKAKKQAYLYENIQKKGINTTEFSNFMNAQKENGNDVDNWTLDEIKAVSIWQFYQHIVPARR